MLKAKVLKTTSSTLINYAKVLRSQNRTSVDYTFGNSTQYLL